MHGAKTSYSLLVRTEIVLTSKNHCLASPMDAELAIERRDVIADSVKGYRQTFCDIRVRQSFADQD